MYKRGSDCVMREYPANDSTALSSLTALERKLTTFVKRDSTEKYLRMSERKTYCTN